MESLDFIAKQAINIDIRANGCGFLPIENYSDSVELLGAFELFYYVNGRFPFTNGFLTIPDGNFPKFFGDQKISIKTLYERFRGTHSHGLVSVLFLAALNLFFAGVPKLSKDAISELYYNLTLQVLSDEVNDVVSTFDAISNLTAELNLLLQTAIKNKKMHHKKDKKKYRQLVKSRYNADEQKIDLKKLKMKFFKVS